MVDRHIKNIHTVVHTHIHNSTAVGIESSYSKLLGNGQINVPVIVKAESFSKLAEQTLSGRIVQSTPKLFRDVWHGKPWFKHKIDTDFCLGAAKRNIQAVTGIVVQDLSL